MGRKCRIKLCNLRLGLQWLICHVSMGLSPLHLVIFQILIDLLLSKQVRDLISAMEIQMLQASVLVYKLRFIGSDGLSG